MIRSLLLVLILASGLFAERRLPLDCDLKKSPYTRLDLSQVLFRTNVEGVCMSVAVEVDMVEEDRIRLIDSSSGQEITYGETGVVMTLPKRKVAEWKILAFHTSLVDCYTGELIPPKEVPLQSDTPTVPSRFVPERKP